MKLLISVFCALFLLQGNMFLAAQTVQMTPDQLDSLVSPIALYPDPLISQILVASTYPLEIVQAYQWLQQNTSLSGQELTDAAQKQGWDPSVASLVVFPDVMKRLAQNVNWTASLGNAFLANQGNTMDAIQRMRLKAQQSGKLATSNQETVTTDQENGQTVVQIAPADPAVIYVPEYDPMWIWGAPGLYAYPAWYYPPVAPIGAWFFWGPAISIGFGFPGCCSLGWGGWGWGFRWSEHVIFVNNDFMNHYHYHGYAGSGHSVWVHDSAHRLGVAYPNRALSQRFHYSARPHLTAGAVQQQLHAASYHVHAQAGGERIGNHTVGSSVYNHSRNSFSGIESGSAARSQSSRGYSSMKNLSTRGAARAPRARVSRGGRGGRGPR